MKTIAIMILLLAGACQHHGIYPTQMAGKCGPVVMPSGITQVVCF